MIIPNIIFEKLSSSKLDKSFNTPHLFIHSIKIVKQNNTLILIIDIQEKLLNAVYNKETLSKKLDNVSLLNKSSTLIPLLAYLSV